MKTVFLDRDGVISKKLPKHQYVKNVSEFEFRDGAIEFLKSLTDLGLQLVVITNQSGVGRGCMTHGDLHDIHDHMVEELTKHGINLPFHHIFYCTEYDNRSWYRKPNPGMFFEAQENLNLTLANSWMIGDSQIDLEAAFNAGIKDVIILNQGKEAFEKALEIIKQALT